MAIITDEYMREKMAETKPFTVVILKRGAANKLPEAYPVIWEHGRKNFSLHADGLLPIVCPIRDENESNVAGIGVFTTGTEETKKILEEDRAIKAGILVYEIYPTKTFPGSCLPK